MKRATFSLSKLLILSVILVSSLQLNAQERKIIQINDVWQFLMLDEEIEYVNIVDSSWQDVQIPHTWNNKDIQSGNKVRYGTAWYRRNLIIEKDDISRQYFLRFSGVGQYAEIYINDKFVGNHRGGYSAFVFNITRFIDFDIVNTINVRVNNEIADSYPKDNFLFGMYGGIYREVSLISTNDLHIALSDYGSSGVYVHQEGVSAKKATLNIVTNLINQTSTKEVVTIKQTLFSEDNKKVVESTKEIVLFPGGLVPVKSFLKVKNPHLWNGKKDPYLYHVVTELVRDGKTIDVISHNVGIRYFSIDPEKGFILNGDPYRLFGVCRHQEWQDRGNALLPEHHKKDMDLIDEIGATSIRLAHYQQAEYIYSLADSIGILIWAEIPFVNGYIENADENAVQQLIELIKQNINHPSIFVWGLHNEVLKNNIVSQPVNLTNKLNSVAKELDPDRYTVAVSNIWWIYDHPIHQLADLQGFNQYTGWYGGKPSELKNWINNYHKSKPDVRISISEYGAGGNIFQQTNDIITVPDPSGQFFPETYETYYHEETYSAIEKSPFIWSSYVWNMFDFSVPEWNRGGIKGRNHKGLITYDRKIKKDAFYWYKANWSDEPVLYLTGRRNNSSDTKLCGFKAYCNIGTPELFVNGKSVGKMSKGINSVQFMSRDISLESGENKIQIKMVLNNSLLHDEYIMHVK